MHISIIGAGPIGNYTAFLLAKQGHDVHIYEDHDVIGTPIQCTGLMTISLNDIFVPAEEYMTNKVEVRDIVAPNGKKVTMKSPEYLVHRTQFDQHLANQAESAGAKIHTNHRFIEIKDGKIILKDTKTTKLKEVKTDILIGADGANSTVAKILNPKRQRKYCVGIQARVSGAFDPKQYTVYFDNNISPGFFAWIVPENEKTARVGLKGTSTNFDSFINKHGFEKIEMQAGPIPIYDTAYITEKKDKRMKIYLVGDAATHVKATTAGGIIPGLKAAQCLADAIKNNDSYKKRWKKAIGKDLWLHLKIRNALDKFTNDDWNKLIELLSQDKVKAVFEKHDREKPWKLMKALIIEPRLLKFAKYVM